MVEQGNNIWQDKTSHSQPSSPARDVYMCGGGRWGRGWVSTRRTGDSHSILHASKLAEYVKMNMLHMQRSMIKKTQEQRQQEDTKCLWKEVLVLDLDPETQWN